MKKIMQQKTDQGIKKYILKNKGLLSLTLLLGAIFSAGSTMIALILKNVIDVSLSANLSEFYSIVIQTVCYLSVLGVCYGFYSTFSKKIIGKVTRMLRNDAFKDSGVKRS